MAQQSGRVQRHRDRRRRHRYAPVPGTHCSSISPLHSKINDEKAQASITDQAAQYPNIAKNYPGPGPRTYQDDWYDV